MEQQTAKFENPRHKVLQELGRAHDERISGDLAPIEGAPAVEFEPAPQLEPQTVKGSASPPDPEKAAEVEVAGSPETPAAPAEEVKAAEQPRAADGTFAPKPELVTVKIDGETLQVPKADIDAVGSVALYQIEKTSAKRLQKINEQSRSLAEQNAQLARMIQEQKQQPAAPAAPQPNQDEALLARANAIAFGDDAQRLQAMKEMSQPATIPVGQIEDRVMKKIEFENAEKAFVERAKDILYTEPGKLHPIVYEVAMNRVARLRSQISQTGQYPANPDEFYKNMESELRTHFGKSAATGDIAMRAERKVDIAEPKAAAGRVPAPAEKKPLTVAEQIDQQRKARGQKPLYH